LGPAWAHAFLAAGFVTLAGTPLLRRLALATEFVDRPVTAAHKSHGKPIPYLGGVGLITAVLIGLLFADRLTRQVAVIALGGSLIGCLGLLDDHRNVGPLVRFGLELGVAAVALGVGLRIHATDVPVIDAVITLVWIVGVTNAVNLLDNMDGLAAGVSAAAATAIFALAVLGEQAVTATVAAGLAGACLGFLVHNKRPASIFMGDTGSLFLGFVLAVVAIDVSPALTPPASFAVPLMLLALPVLDTATVTFARLRRRRQVSLGGRDHLSHRLVALGLSPGAAVGVLVAAEAAAGLAALMAGRDVVSLLVAVLAVAGVLTALAFVTLRAPVYEEPVVGLPRSLRLTAAAGVLGVVLLAAPAAVAMARGHGPGIAGAGLARAGLEALAAGDATRATALFDQAAAKLSRAQDHLGGRLSSLGLLLPGMRANLATTRALVDAGHDVSLEARELSTLAEVRSLALDDGPDVVDATARLAPALEKSASVLQRSMVALAGYNRPYLWPSVAATVRDLRASLVEASALASTAAEASRLAPALLGGQGPRAYFVGIQDSAELRGAGGVIRFWGEVVAEGGRMRLARFGPVEELKGSGDRRALQGLRDFVDRYRTFDPANTWQNVNVSPDFKVTGEVITTLYPQSGGRAVDGVMAVDVAGLAALLELADPVRVEGWPEPLTGANLADVVVRGAPQRFPDEAERKMFLARLYQGTLDSLLAADLRSPSELAAALGPAVRKGHLMFYASRAEEEHLFERLGATGHVPDVTGDSIFIVNQNLTAAPVDAQLRRHLRYEVRIDPGLEPAAVTGRVDVTLANAAVAENRTQLSVYTPFALRNAPPGVESSSELGRRAYTTDVSIPSQQSRTVSLDIGGRMELASGTWYHLDLPRRSSLVPDETEVSISVPPEWRILEAEGCLDVLDSRHATAKLSVDSDHRVSIRLQRTAWSRLWARARR
jgi:UDP-GlcNAc:undecaprenyl-phosphate/decaprenyl-phosphate GlcNAc-1-phosphate transferase